MTANEKQLIYNLLKTSSNAINGYTTKAFEQNAPIFSDDIINKKDDLSCSQIKSESFSANKIIENPHSNNIPESINKKSTVSMASIAQRIHNCNRCKLFNTRTNTVPGMGVEKPLVLVIGEGPGHDEDMQGLPFVGAAGQLLDKMLAAISLSRKQNCYIANIVKCRPPQNRDPQPDEIQSCFSYLEAQVNILNPKMILLVGRIPSQVILKTSAGINSLRGTIFQYNQIPLMATYHPSALLRNPELKGPAWQDLKKFRVELLKLVPDYEKSFVKE